MLFGLNDKMQKVSLPPLSSGIQVSVPAREPPQRSWSRFKKVLIDNPKDSDLLQRQKLWNFQKLNRGAFRSHLASLPDIPYRVHTNTVEKVSVAVQADVNEQLPLGARILFPRLAARREKIFSLDSDDSDEDDSCINTDQRHKACSPIQTPYPDYSDEFDDDDSTVDDLDLDFDSVLRRQNAGTMTESKCKGVKTPKKEKRKKSIKARNSVRRTEKQSILKTAEQTTGAVPLGERKFVKFESNVNNEDINTNFAEDNTLPQLRKEKPLSPKTPRKTSENQTIPFLLNLELTENDGPTSRPSSSASDNSMDDSVNIPMDKMGHSSHLSLDNLSILDLLSGSKTERSRKVNKWQPLTGRLDDSRRQRGSETDLNRIWFEQIVGDKEVIDVGTYDSFARTRPSADTTYSDSNEKYTDLNRNSSRKNTSGRLSDEFATYRQVVSKNSQAKLSANSSSLSNKSRNTKRKS